MSKHSVIRLSNKTFDTYSAYKMVWSALPYNTKIITPADSYALYRLDNILQFLPSDGIMNPKKMGIFSRNEIDPAEYCFYIISKSVFKGFWGGKFMYDDPTTGGISEPVFIRINYNFAVENPKQLINCGDFSYISSHSETSAEDIACTVRDKLSEGGLLNSIICNVLYEKGIEGLQAEMAEIIKKVECELNEKIFARTGICISGIKIEAEESDLHVKVRNNLRWHEYISDSVDKKTAK